MPLLHPVIQTFYNFLYMERGHHFPFYITHSADHWADHVYHFLDFMDYLVDAHEDERNKQDQGLDFYKRSVYVFKNFHRYSNPTLGNIMFDTKASKPQYDRLNSVLAHGLAWHYGSMVGLHSFSFMYLTYHMRYRRVAALPCLLISGVYYNYFQLTNKISYKLNVDGPVAREAKKLGLGHFVQKQGAHIPKGFNINFA